MKKTDTKPWYKQFWPWFLIVFPLGMVVICLVLFYIAARQPISMVKQDYYKEGLAINKNIEQEKQAVQWGVHAVINLTADHHIQVQLQTAEVIPDTDSMILQFDHPLDSNKDIVLALQPTANHVYVSDTLDAAQWQFLQNEKRWYVYLYAREDSDRVRWQVQSETTSLTASGLTLDARAPH